MTVAPEQTGIGIRRHFTTEGTHPYDELEWERRDARITNFRDGSVAFEQTDVEFPIGWSLNATNIVAQKYFRGVPGTPERESSLRQVIDRVVDTITTWGVEGGYFADDQEAEAFRAELQHLMATQKAAFNSPVWFNIGVKGVPAQASACFILSVDDTMDSILNWYVEEGTIFKGGSGSGINLSRIRSSVELLRGGGTASGPVSFMRGADASAGTIKSGGKTRRAAKMVILNVDHPDVEEFIWCKAREERKARVLRDAGFDMDLDGRDSHSTQYQNANNSVRVTDEFMRAVERDEDWHLRAVTTGEVVKTMRARDLMRQIAHATWECADPGMQFDTTINRWHTAASTGPITASNPCSEYLHLDNSACNLASINLLRFLPDDDGGTGFDLEGFRQAVEVVFCAQEILIGRADYPTPAIGETTRRFRQLGLGYANLGALLMALGLPYDSDAGRAWAGAITALLTGHAYATSARIAARMGPFAGYTENAEHMLRVLGMHREAAAGIDGDLVPVPVRAAAREAWDEACELAGQVGVRNSQASVLAPTGCLVGGTLVASDRGLVRLRSLGDTEGPQWQPLDATVVTDDGPRPASRFYVNGLEPVVDVTTAYGYRIRGTATHRIKVVNEHGAWVWRRLADLRSGDRVPLAVGQAVGEPRPVALAPMPAASRWSGEHHLHAPSVMTAELAELIGYFMGDGKVSGRGLRFFVPGGDYDVIDHLERTVKSLFGAALEAGPEKGFVCAEIASARLAEWWRTNGFDTRPSPQVPDAILETNDPEICAAFLRGLFESEGAVVGGSPSWTTTSPGFSEEVQTLLLSLGYPTARWSARTEPGREVAMLRLLERSTHGRWDEQVGFLSARKGGRVDTTVAQGPASARWFFDTVTQAELGDEELTYDLSVPDNLTYVANGFVSHNTIGLMMDCDTTGVEPDLGLCKMKKLVGGGTMTIVNQTVPRALRRLGYTDTQVDEIVAYVDEHKTILGAPHLTAEHIPVFACSMGDNPIHYQGHVRMMGAVQPFISGAISKTVNMPEDATVEDVEQLHVDAWKLGVKAIAIYRDNCKVAQPLATAKKDAAEPVVATEVVEKVVERVVTVKQPVREKLPRNRRSRTFEFRVADCKGFVTVGEYDDGRPGEIWMNVSKQGSTLAGIMDAFAKSISYGLQYGVPLRAYVETLTNMRFEPAGMTDDPELRLASSLVDYIFRRLAVDYLSFEERAELGILTVAERIQPSLPGVEETVTETRQGSDLLPDPKSSPSASELAASMAAESTAPARPARSDAPYCMQCGVQMIRAGSCHACPSCGSTSGCS
jgi:ribonucleoside-diphosphate reductase alpha chain